MAQLAADFTVTFDLRTGLISVRDTTAGEPTGIGLKDWKGVITNITAPSGSVIHENTIAGTPDFVYYTPEHQPPGGSQIILEAFYPNPTSSTEIAIPELSAGGHQKGLYSISIELKSATDTYTATKTVNFNYEKPEGELKVTYNIVDPEFKSVDITDYSLDGFSVSLSRSHTISFPDNLRPDFLSSLRMITTDSFYTTQQVVTLSTEATWTKGSLIVKDTITATEDGDDSYVVVVKDMEQIYFMVNAIYKKYISAEGENSAHAQKIFKDLMIANALLSLLRSAIRYEDTDGIEGYAERIKEIAERWGCGCSSLDVTPTLVTGLYIVDIDTVTPAYASDGQGTDFSFIPNDGVHTYVAFYAHPHQNTPIKSDYTGLWVKFVGDDGTGGGSGGEFNGNRPITRDGDFKGLVVGGTTTSEFLERLHFPPQQPVITEPIVSMTISGAATREVGTVITETATLSLDKGLVMGSPINGVWQPNTAQGYRSGDGGYFEIAGTEIISHPNNTAQKQVTRTIFHGSNTISGQIDIEHGIIPLDSTGEPSDVIDPYLSQTVNRSVNVKGEYKIFYGAIATVPSGGADGRTLPQNRFETDGDTFILNTWDQHTRFCILLPPTKTFVGAVDIDAIGQPMDYLLIDPDFLMLDANGVILPVQYKLYVCSQTIPNQDNHRHEITIQ